MAGAEAPRGRRFGPGVLLTAAVALAAVGACTKDRYSSAPAPTYDDDVRAILSGSCASCHSGATPAAGWSVTSYLSVIGCVSPSGQTATLPADDRAPIVRALESASHVGLLAGSAKNTLIAWVANGAPAFHEGVHEPGIVDPRSPAFHGAKLREKHWSPMLDGADDEACGRCHDGTPGRPVGVKSAAPGAPACTTCHTDDRGVLGCTTCHGDGARIFPPRDPCFFPADANRGGAHSAHLEKRSTHQTTIECTTCHALPGTPVISGTHGNGAPDVVFDPKVVAAGGTFDAATGSCTVSCHDRGGPHARPAWSDPAPGSCSSCHASPPENHHPGPCTTCHREANATGTALTGGPMHLNGKVDLGDGSGGCGACHGKGDDPMPTTNAHLSHRTPGLGPSVDCANCHQPHTGNLYDAGHLDGVVQVSLGGHAADRGTMPTWDGSTCSNVACHGAGLAQPPITVPTWTDTTGTAKACGACHGIPPINHTPATDCGRSDCHAGQWIKEGNFRSITELGKMLHIDGMIEVQNVPLFPEHVTTAARVGRRLVGALVFVALAGAARPIRLGGAVRRVARLARLVAVRSVKRGQARLLVAGRAGRRLGDAVRPVWTMAARAALSDVAVLARRLGRVTTAAAGCGREAAGVRLVAGAAFRAVAGRRRPVFGRVATRARGRGRGVVRIVAMTIHAGAVPFARRRRRDFLRVARRAQRDPGGGDDRRGAMRLVASAARQASFVRSHVASADLRMTRRARLRLGLVSAMGVMTTGTRVVPCRVGHLGRFVAIAARHVRHVGRMRRVARRTGRVLGHVRGAERSLRAVAARAPCRAARRHLVRDVAPRARGVSGGVGRVRLRVARRARSLGTRARRVGSMAVFTTLRPLVLGVALGVLLEMAARAGGRLHRRVLVRTMASSAVDGGMHLHRGVLLDRLVMARDARRLTLLGGERVARQTTLSLDVRAAVRSLELGLVALRTGRRAGALEPVLRDRVAVVAGDVVTPDMLLVTDALAHLRPARRHHAGRRQIGPSQTARDDRHHRGEQDGHGERDGQHASPHARGHGPPPWQSRQGRSRSLSLRLEKPRPCGFPPGAPTL